MSRWALSQNAERPPSIRSDAWEGFCQGLKHLDNAAADIAKAGKLFAEISEAQWDRLVANAPAPIRRTLNYTRDVGKGLLIPQLATASGDYVSRLRAFPVEDQERLLHTPIEVVVRSGGGFDTKMEKVPEMESTTIRQVFAKEGRKWIERDQDQQRAWIIAQERKQSAEEPSPVINRPGRWKVERGRVYIAAAKAKAGLTVADLEKIHQDLEKNQ